MQTIVFLLLGIAVGFALGWLVVTLRRSAGAGDLQRALAERDAAAGERQRADAELRATRTRVEEEQRTRVEAETKRAEAERLLAEKQQWIDQQRDQLKGEYARLSNAALNSAVEQLLQVVKPHLDGAQGAITSSLDAKKSEIDQLLLPLRTMIETYQGELKASEEKRNQGYASIEQQVKQLLEATEATRKEASKVATALSNPKVSGGWGEQQLQRCVELAGMSEYCDFSIQETFENKESQRLRPDMVVNLPHGRVIAVDSKAPLTAYLEAMAATDEKRQAELLKEHARNIKRHIDALGAREYHEHIGNSLDLTVLFLGGEQFLYAALSAEPELFEYGAQRRVFIATPTVLVPLLRVVAATWRAEKSEENAKKALEMGKDLFERFVVVFGHFEDAGTHLGRAVKSYNSAVKSVDSRLVPKALELKEAIETAKEMPALVEIQQSVVDSAKLPVQTKLAIDGEEAGTDQEAPEAEVSEALVES